MNPTSYLDKTFVVEDSHTYIRQPSLVQFETYQEGDELPPGKHVGDIKSIPVGTEVRLKAAQLGHDSRPFVFAEPVAGGVPSGWTAASNLRGKLANETIGLEPAPAGIAFQGNNRTVTDSRAFIRQGPPGFASTGQVIPRGTLVVVTETQNQNSRLSHGKAVDGQLVVEGEIGWTRSSNLTDGWFDMFGANAAWDDGKYIGQKDLVHIVCADDETEQVTADHLDHYIALATAAKADGILLSIKSSFRTYAEQQYLYTGFIQHLTGFNTAAEPGSSNHQHGQAFDLNSGTIGDAVYKWLKRNAPAHGFIRTVPREPWHWEYRPDEANHPPGRYKRDNVNP